MSKFQFVILGIFGVFIVIGVIVFSAYRGSEGEAFPVTIWGTVPESAFNEILQKTFLFNNKQFKINYSQKSESDFDSEFIEALASGSGPDLFVLPSYKIMKHRNKVFPIPYDVFTERQFKDSFVEGSEIYMSPNGVLGLPIYSDPLVMYWNRSIFNDARITEPPKYWDEFYELSNKISKKDGALNILKSAVSFGEFSNISNAKEILLNLVMQAGSPISLWSEEGPKIVFDSNYSSKPILPAEAALIFYTEFSNPAKKSYSWNRSLPNSTNYFLSNDLALYFGFASEARLIQLKNPNLNFDVAEVPLSRDGGVDVSYANFYALSITKSSTNKNAAFTVASILSSSEGSKAFSDAVRLPPVRRDLLSKKSLNAYDAVFYESVIRGRSWLDPSPQETNLIFKNMIESVTSNLSRVSDAVSRGAGELLDVNNNF